MGHNSMRKRVKIQKKFWQCLEKKAGKEFVWHYFMYLGLHAKETKQVRTLVTEKCYFYWGKSWKVCLMAVKNRAESSGRIYHMWIVCSLLNHMSFLSSECMFAFVHVFSLFLLYVFVFCQCYYFSIVRDFRMQGEEVISNSKEWERHYCPRLDLGAVFQVHLHYIFSVRTFFFGKK